MRKWDRWKRKTQKKERQSDENHHGITLETTLNRWRNETMLMLDQDLNDENAIAINNNQKKIYTRNEKRSGWFDCIRVRTIRRLHEHIHNQCNNQNIHFLSLSDICVLHRHDKIFIFIRSNFRSCIFPPVRLTRRFGHSFGLLFSFVAQRLQINKYTTAITVTIVFALAHSLREHFVTIERKQTNDCSYLILSWKPNRTPTRTLIIGSRVY